MSDAPRPTAASAARRGTGDPSVFLIPAEHLPPGLAERVARADLDPAPPRPAATVLLVRDAPGGPEALLLRRHRRSGFAADAWVFPGGVVDAGDRDPAVLGRLDGPTPRAWGDRLGVADPYEAAAYVVAAVREAFEETGILLARPAEGPVAEPGIEELRDELLAGRIGMHSVVVDHDVRITGDELLYLAHWITPEPEPRRYDTRFFLARVPRGAVCTLHEAELTDAVWLTPAAAVERFRRGEMKMLPPTVHTLARVAGFASSADLFSSLRDASVPTVLPTMRRHPDGVAIELPRGPE